MLRMIEVKGRVEGVDTVIVSHNEVLCALNNPDGFILAIVMVDGNTTRRRISGDRSSTRPIIR